MNNQLRESQGKINYDNLEYKSEKCILGYDLEESEKLNGRESDYQAARKGTETFDQPKQPSIYSQGKIDFMVSLDKEDKNSMSPHLKIKDDENSSGENKSEEGSNDSKQLLTEEPEVIIEPVPNRKVELNIINLITDTKVLNSKLSFGAKICSCFINYDTNLWNQFKELQKLPYNNECKLFMIFQDRQLENHESIVPLNNLILADSFATEKNTFICMHFLYYFFRFFPRYTRQSILNIPRNEQINRLKIASKEANRIISANRRLLFRSVIFFVSISFKIFSVIFSRAATNNNDFNLSLSQIDSEFIRLDYLEIINRKSN